MPSQIIHLLAGERALALASGDLASAIARDGEARRWFGMGCQGPDVFYHNQRTRPSGLHYGSLAHRREYGTIVEAAFRNWQGGAGARTAGESPLDPAFAWLLGFATHAALDRSLHPFVIYFSGWVDPSRPESLAYRSCHPFLERLLDLAWLKRETGLEGRSFDLEAYMPLGRQDEEGSRVEDCVKAILAVGLSRAFPRAAAGDFLMARRIANALEDARHFYRFTNPARTGAEGVEVLEGLDEATSPRRLSVVYPLAPPAGLDVANQAHEVWLHPAGDGRSSRASAFDLVEEGIRGAAEAIGLLLAEEAHPSLADGGMARALGTGSLSVADREGRAVRPLLSRPLPLEAVLEREFRLRLERARGLH